jgi:predicted XRE-type DNA-binding protein
MTTKIERSTGNVFRDLGFSQTGAESLRLRSELMVEIIRLVKSRKLTQSAAAELLDVSQPRVSDLTRGRIDLFSIDTLIRMLTRAGMRVELRIARSDRRRPKAA